MTEEGLKNIVYQIQKYGVKSNNGRHTNSYILEGLVIALESLGFRVSMFTKSGKYTRISIIDINGYPLVTVNYTTHEIIYYSYTGDTCHN